jgi:hypothetical protein
MQSASDFISKRKILTNSLTPALPISGKYTIDSSSQNTNPTSNSKFSTIQTAV